MTETTTTTVVIVKGDEEYESGVRRIQAHSEQLVEDLGRIAKAWTNAHTSYWRGAVRVLGDLAVNLNRPSSRRRTTDLVADAASRLRDVTSSVSQAVSDTADVASDAMGRFSDEVANRPAGSTTSSVKTEPTTQPAATTVIWTPPGTE